MYAQVICCWNQQAKSSPKHSVAQIYLSARQADCLYGIAPRDPRFASPCEQKINTNLHRACRTDSSSGAVFEGERVQVNHQCCLPNSLSCWLPDSYVPFAHQLSSHVWCQLPCGHSPGRAAAKGFSEAMDETQKVCLRVLAKSPSS